MRAEFIVILAVILISVAVGAFLSFACDADERTEEDWRDEK